MEGRNGVEPVSVPLVVFTDTYPFDVGEEFFEQEISYLAERFAQVWVVPLRVSVGAAKTRTLPPNVTAVLLPLEDGRIWKQRLVHLAPRLLAGPGRVELSSAGAKPLVRELHYAVDVLHRLDLFLTTRLYREHLAGRPFVAYGYWLYHGAGVARMLKAVHDAEVVAVSRAHAYDVDEADSPGGHLPARRRLVSGLDEIYPISHYAQSFLLPYRKADGAAIEIRHLGVPAPAGAMPLPPDAPGAPVPGDAEPTGRPVPVHIVSCSHLAPYKRVDRLADAVGVLARQGRPVRWTHIGERDEQRLAQMRGYADAVAPGAQVELLGYVPNARTRELLATGGYTLLTNTSSGEGVPVSIMEAMAAGLPVVATDVGGTREIVHDGVNGRLVPAQATGEDIARAVAEVADQEERAMARTRAAARRTWDEEFNAPRQYTALAEHLAGLARRVVEGSRS
ncbi:glycosyltransferase [Actinomyces sp. AC-18-1]|nr:glycosyltransferase [Actinomyces sp. 186855]MCL3789036.1 glycosyltransferase [Actinomyces sp. 187325]